jgi:sterol desaturase/sphingolipid hydroxylase (fatty acid hydroxylase superfamily)
MHPTGFSEYLLHQLTRWLPVYFGLLVGAETIYRLFKFKQAFSRETRVNLLTGGITIAVQGVLKTWLLTDIYPQVYTYRIWEISPGLFMWVTGFLLYTFLQFFTHYLYHKVRLFWCLHEVHHSATEMNTTTGLRTSVFDVVSLDLLYLLIPLTGVHPLVYFILYTVNKFWGAWIHVHAHIAKKVPLPSFLVVTPAAHHIHHARNIPYLDKNYGELVPWFDMLFGTYAKETEKPVFGTLQVNRAMGFWETQLHEIRRLYHDIRQTPQWRHKLGFLFMPPGWKPGNFRKTAWFIQQKHRLRIKMAASGSSPK